MIEMQQMMVRYPIGKIALSGVSLSIQAGTMNYLLGESGAGKSTLLHSLYGAVRPTSGMLRVHGVDVRQASDQQIRLLRRRVGVVFQDHKLLNDRTVFENVALPLRVQSCAKGIMQARVRKVLGFVGLSSYLDAYPEALSGGEQQRVAIARAMVAQPPLILADEPTGNLDDETACRVVAYFKALVDQGLTVLMTTHDKRLPKTFPGQVFRLHAGALQACD